MPKEEFVGKRTPEAIKEFWNALAEKYPLDPTTTIRDHYFRELQIDEVRKYLDRRDVVLDAGCGNGFGTVIYSQDVREIVGIDFAEKMIESARRMARSFPRKDVATRGNFQFRLGDIQTIPYKDQYFDKVIAERVLVNLTTRRSQNRAIREVHRVLKPSGKYIAVEATLQGLEKVDRMRGLFGLPPMQRHANNVYVDETHFVPYVSRFFKISEIIRFGMYHFLSKVVHPLVVHPKEPEFVSRFNEVAKLIGSAYTNFMDCSHHVMFVLEKM